MSDRTYISRVSYVSQQIGEVCPPETDSSRVRLLASNRRFVLAEVIATGVIERMTPIEFRREFIKEPKNV